MALGPRVLTEEPGPVSFCVFGGALIDRVGLFETPFHPGQSHPGHWQQTIGGVASNVARHLAHFGAQVQFASVFSDDASAQTVCRQLVADGLSIIPDCIFPDSTTPTYTVMHDPSGDVIAGLADMALHEHMNEVWARKVALAGAASTHWIADTNITPAALAELASLKGDRPLFLVVVSPAKALGLTALLPHIDGIICNRQEAEAVAASIFADAASAAQGLVNTGLPLCIVSDGAQPGAFARKTPDQDLQLVVKAPVSHLEKSDDPTQQRFRMTGVGDMFAAASLFALCSKTAIAAEDILQHAHAAARLAMQEDDTCPAIGWRAVTTAADKEKIQND